MQRHIVRFAAVSNLVSSPGAVMRVLLSAEASQATRRRRQKNPRPPLPALAPRLHSPAPASPVPNRLQLTSQRAVLRVAEGQQLGPPRRAARAVHDTCHAVRHRLRHALERGIAQPGLLWKRWKATGNQQPRRSASSPATTRSPVKRHRYMY